MNALVVNYIPVYNKSLIPILLNIKCVFTNQFVLYSWWGNSGLSQHQIHDKVYVIFVGTPAIMTNFVSFMLAEMRWIVTTR